VGAKPKQETIIDAEIIEKEEELEEYEDEDVECGDCIYDEEFCDSFSQEGMVVAAVIEIPLTEDDIDHLEFRADDENESLVETAYFILMERGHDMQYVEGDVVDRILQIPITEPDVEMLDMLGEEDESLEETLYRLAFLADESEIDTEDATRYKEVVGPDGDVLLVAEEAPESVFSQLLNTLNGIPTEKKIAFISQVYQLINVYGTNAFMKEAQRWAGERFTDFMRQQG
jgi:hypothetical protein